MVNDLEAAARPERVAFSSGAMGISRFASRIRDHGSVNVVGRKGESRNDYAIIDGPSLAHSLLGDHPEQSKDGSIMPLPDYTALGEMAVAWLDNLQEHGSNM